MSINSKIQFAQAKLDDIFQLLRDYDVEVSDDSNLINLQADLQTYFENGGGKKEYTVVDYVYGDGHQYINTGIKMGNTIAIELKFKFESWNEGESLGGFSKDDIDFNILVNNDNNFVSSIGSGEDYIIDSVDSSIHTLIYNTYGKRLVFDDTQKTFIKNVEQQGNQNDLLIFANSNNGIKPTGRIYSCKIYDNLTGQILRFFIPVIDKNDTACLYDLVSQEFFYSDGDENFY